MFKLWRGLAVLCALAVLSGGRCWADNPNVYPNVPDPTPGADAVADTAKESSLTPGQLDTLVAPIALYPDSLMSQILVASTYPLEIVQAEQWLEQHPELKGEDLTSAAQQQNWDASIQALVLFPEVVKRLSQDVTWTTNVGNAFLARQGDVMDAIQRMRLKAEESGKLASTPQEKVTTSTESGQKVIAIEPANPQVVYVPYYDPNAIWGPPDYYAYPAWDYPARPVGVSFWFGDGIWLTSGYAGCCGWGGWGWSPHWHDRTIIVNNNFIHRYNFHSSPMASLHGTAVWRHDAAHRLGVAYPSRSMAERYRPNLAPRPHPTVAQVQTQFHASAQRVQAGAQVHAAAPVGDRIGRRTIPFSGGYKHNYSAFGGIQEGSRARVSSDRGYSSLSRVRSAGHSAGAAIHSVGGGHAGGGHSGDGSADGHGGGSSGGGRGH